MAIKNKLSVLTDRIKEIKHLKLYLLIISSILPVLFILTLTNIIDSEVLNFMSCLWVGFYSSIFLIKFVEKSWIEGFLIVINISIILFSMFVSLMGGIHGILIVTINIILPFIPTEWIGEFILYLIP